jgi:hypothetical protein
MESLLCRFFYYLLLLIELLARKLEIAFGKGKIRLDAERNVVVPDCSLQVTFVMACGAAIVEGSRIIRLE